MALLPPLPVLLADDVMRSWTPTPQRPRLPEAFWDGALTTGMAGTCFESNALRRDR